MNTPAKLTVTVGTPLVMIDRGTGRHDARLYFGYTVTRVSPSGKFEATSDKPGFEGKPLVRFFNSQGYEVEGNMNGKGRRYGFQADTDVAKWEAHCLAKALARNARDALNAVKLAEPARDTWGKESLQNKLSELENLMALARAAVEAM